MRSKLTTLFLLLALLFLPTGAVHAQSPDGGDVFLLGQNYTLKSDETLDGSLVVIGGNVDIEKNATVNGDSVLIGGNLQVNGDANGSVVLIGGNLVISGKIKGDIVLIGGQALLTETAVVDGDIVTMGGQVQKDPGAEVTGQIVNNAPPIDVPDIPAEISGYCPESVDEGDRRGVARRYSSTVGVGGKLGGRFACLG